MRNALFLLGILALAPACAAPRPSATATPEPGLDDALARAGRSGRNVMVLYESDSCSWCAKMEREVFSLPEVGRALEGVEFVRVRREGDPAAFEARWGKPGTPSFVVLRPDGSQAGDLVAGAMGSDDFLAYVAWAERAEGPAPALRLFGS